MTEEEVCILRRELGEVATVRFLNQFRSGSGDYTEERKKLFEGLTLEEALAEIRRIQK